MPNGLVPIQEHPAWSGANRYGCRFSVLPATRQLQVLLDAAGALHVKRHKAAADLTLKARADVCHQFIRQVGERGFRVHNLLNLSQRHIQCAVDSWLESGLAAATIATRLSILRWLCKSLGKGGMVGAAEAYGVPPDAIARTYIARTDKSVTGRSMNPEEVVRSATEIDPWVGLVTELMWRFGLRLREAILFAPVKADRVTSIMVEHGTKGGRVRPVQITSPAQRAVLDRACQYVGFADTTNMVPPGMLFTQARNRVYYVLHEKLRLGRATNGVTPHSFRHEFAQATFEQSAGAPSLLRGSRHIDRTQDRDARSKVTKALGHARLSITGAYVGPRPVGRPRLAPLVVPPPMENAP